MEDLTLTLKRPVSPHSCSLGLNPTRFYKTPREAFLGQTWHILFVGL